MGKSAKLSWRRGIRVIDIALIGAGLLTPAVAIQADAAEPAVLSPKIIPLSDPEIFNTIRGQYDWIEGKPQPATWKHMDVYYRDEIQWGKNVELTPWSYDLSAFESGLAEAQSKGGRFGFRIMAYCPGCGKNLTPSFVPRQSNGLPDWNSEGFLSSYTNLINAVGAKYGNDPRLGWVDAGGYGAWGEWHLYQEPGDVITDANAKRILDAVLQAFPASTLS